LETPHEMHIHRPATTFGFALIFAATLAPAQVATNTAAPTTRLGRVGTAVEAIPGDLKLIASYPFEQRAEFAKYALGVAALIAFDKPLTTAYQEWVEKPLSGFRVSDAPRPFTNLGTGGTDGWLLLAISGSYLGGLAVDDGRMQDAALASTKALAYSMVITQALLKSAAGRKRPQSSLRSGSPGGDVYTDNPFDFGNPRQPTFRSEQRASSFPSFHFTGWFAAARVYQQVYDNYTVPYTLMTIGLASKIEGHRHWVSDMAAGALIGTLIGTVSARSARGDSSGARMSVALLPDQVAIRFTRRF
jgi:hypothetical protein